METEHHSKTTSDKSSDLQKIQAEFDAIQKHLKNIMHTGSHLLKQQGSKKAGQSIKALETQMQKNPFATACAALVGDIILGKVFTSCRKKR